MTRVRILPIEKLGRDFISGEHLPHGRDEYYLRNLQNPHPPQFWRQLRAEEVQTLDGNGNNCDDWNAVLVRDPFTPDLIRGCSFHGLVRIGRLERVLLEHHELEVPAGITDSLIVACDIGDNAAIHNVRYLAHFIVGDHVILLNVDEMNTTNHAKFGNGIVKDGEAEEVRIWLDLMNEAGGRSVMPFDGMIAADAYLWAKYRDDADLVARLGTITQRQFGSRRGFYGTIGDECVIKNSRILKDVKIGPCCYIKGANKLKNLTINSTPDEPTQIGEGVELVNGIVGLGCQVFYGCKAVRFVLGDNSKLAYGARLIHSFLGDNSTVSCCEILNNLVFPAHEQHHNNSFLTASLVMGQSNLAAAASVGSNHNSRANDGEIQAGRGFWPGLSVTLKHSSRFAAFVLIVKGSYPAPLDVPLPFSLVSNDEARDRLVIMPAYWWLYNMYALTRNAWKFRTRDRRKRKTQKVEFDALAPDTAEEMLRAMELLEIWTAQAHLRCQNETAGETPDSWLAALGRRLLRGPGDQTADLEVVGERVENSRRKVVILNARRGYHAYREMLHYYAVKNLLDYWKTDSAATLDRMLSELGGTPQHEWVNLGGQLVPAEEVGRLRSEIRSGTLNSWPEIHQRYEELWDAYPLQKQRHSLATLLTVLGAGRLTTELWESAVQEAIRIQEYVCEQVFLTRRKDYQDPFRGITFRNHAEMQAVLGTAEDNSFVKRIQAETEDFRRLAGAALRRSPDEHQSVPVLRAA